MSVQQIVFLTHTYLTPLQCLAQTKETFKHKLTTIVDV